MLYQDLQPSQCSAYVDRYLTSSGDPLPREDLCEFVENARRAVGAFDRRGALRAGFILANEERSRCRAQLGPQRWGSLLERAHATAAVELNLVWLERELRGGPAAFELWIRIALTLMRLPPRTAIVYAVNTQKAGLARLYRPITIGHIPVERPSDGAMLHYCWSSPARFRRLPLLYARGLFARAARGLLFGGRRRGAP